jgi:CheY-like chemotaxis protein
MCVLFITVIEVSSKQSTPKSINMPHLDTSALERDVDGAALLSSVLDTAVPEAAPMDTIVPSRPGLQILIVEGDRLVRESMAIQLHLRGYVVLEANTGKRALATLRGQQIDVLLTEIEIPARPDGWTLAEEARLHCPSVAVIYTSAQPVRSAREISGSVFVAKPYRTERIMAAIQELTSGTPLPQVAEEPCETDRDMHT